MLRARPNTVRLLAARLCRSCSSASTTQGAAQAAQPAATAAASNGNGGQLLTNEERSQLVSLVLRSFREDPSTAASILAKSLTEDSKRELQGALEATNDRDGLRLSRQLMLSPEASSPAADTPEQPQQQAGAAEPAAAALEAPTWPQLVRVAFTKGLPFVAFGFFDNVIMITAGDEIDAAFGVKLGLSSMAAAGLGNTIADVVGINISHSIEQHFRTIKWMATPLTKAQWAMKQTKRAKWVGCAVGMAVGCLLGLVPLLFMSDRKKEGHHHQQHDQQQQEQDHQQQHDPGPVPAL